MRDEQGASLIEQLIAVALIGIAIVTLLYALTAGVLGVGIIDERVTAGNLASSALESVKKSGFFTDTLSYTPVISVPDGYDVQVTASTTVTGLQLITANVYHNGRLIWWLEDYKVNR